MGKVMSSLTGPCAPAAAITKAKGQTKVPAMTRANGLRAFKKREAVRLFDTTARRYVGVSGTEFLKKLDENKWDLSEPRVFRVTMLLPLVRKTSAQKKTV